MNRDLIIFLKKGPNRPFTLLRPTASTVRCLPLAPPYSPFRAPAPTCGPLGAMSFIITRQYTCYHHAPLLPSPLDICMKPPLTTPTPARPTETDPSAGCSRTPMPLRRADHRRLLPRRLRRPSNHHHRLHVLPWNLKQNGFIFVPLCDFIEKQMISTGRRYVKTSSCSQLASKQTELKEQVQFGSRY